MIGAFVSLLLAATLEEGRAAASNGNHDEAIRIYREVLAEDSTAYEARFQLARSLSFSGKRDEAIAEYSVLLERSPTNSDVLIGRGRVYSWMKRYDESERDLLIVTEKSPTYSDAWRALGDMYYWSDRNDSAIATYTKLIELNPDDHEPLSLRAKALRAADRLEPAEADMRKAVEKGADPGELASFLANLQRRKQNPSASIPEGFLWSLSASGGVTQFTPTRADWRDGTLSLRRSFKYGSLAVEYLSVDRFGKSDDAWALDGYVDLWPRAYANLRYQWSPDDELFPGQSWLGEVFQGAGKGWELSGSWSHQEFGLTNTDMYGVGVGKYWKSFYGRARTLIIPNSHGKNLSHRGLVRWYYSGSADDYVELTGGWSRGGQARRDGSIEQTEGESYGIAVERWLNDYWGVKVSGSYGDDKNSFVERDVSFSLSTRW